jgi:hypothetical protein
LEAEILRPPPAHLLEELTTKSPNEKETDVGLLEKALLSKDDFLRRLAGVYSPRNTS